MKCKLCKEKVKLFDWTLQSGFCMECMNWVNLPNYEYGYTWRNRKWEQAN